MLFFDGIVGFAILGLWIFCLIDVVTTDASLCRNLQKGWWVLIVLLLFDIGAVLWLIAGRPRPQNAGHGPTATTGGRYVEYERPERAVAASPDDDEEFLRRCRERADEQRRIYREQQQRKNEDPASPTD